MSKKTYELEEVLNKQGFLIYPIKGISMLPLLIQGEDTVKIVPLKKDEVLKCYDCALYHNDSGSFTLHRIVKVHKRYYEIIGDNCNNIERVSKRDCVGKMVGYFKKKRWVSCDSEEYINYINKNIINVNYKTREKIYPDIRLEWKFLFALIRLSIGVNVIV